MNFRKNLRSVLTGLALVLLFPTKSGNEQPSSESKWVNLNCVRVDYPDTRTAHYFIDRDGDEVLDEYIIARFSENGAKLPRALTSDDVTYHRVNKPFYSRPLLETPVKSILERNELNQYQRIAPQFMPSKK